MIWKCSDLEVHYAATLDGYGTTLALPFLEAVRAVAERRYRRCFEWCSGPGFLAITLWRAGLADELVLADKNPAVRPWVEKTRRANDLPLTYYESDNFEAIPQTERFDLVIANPPNYCRLNPEHPAYLGLRDDPRPNDPGWAIHDAFYARVADYLEPGADLFVSEVELDRTEVFLPEDAPDIPYDLRNEAPRRTFSAMIADAGLELVSAEPYCVSRGVTFHLVHSRFPG